MFASLCVPTVLSFFYITIRCVSILYFLFFWSLSTGCCYFVASFEQQRKNTAFLTIFAPATIASLTMGQTGLLSAALIVGGFRVVTTRPVLGGILLGLASFKPQLGILIPIALISARLWRTIAAACATVLVLVLASGVVFGWSIWPLWFAKLLPHADWVMDVKDRLNPTITSSLTSIGVDLPVARSVQAGAGIFVAIIIWICFRKGITILATALLFVGTFLATPYAIFYDMPMLTNAVLAVLRDEEQTNRVLTIPELIILASTLILPVVMLATWRLAMLRSIPLIFFFGLVVWRILRTPGRVPTSA